jgi:hypothetical protein
MPSGEWNAKIAMRREPDQCPECGDDWSECAVNDFTLSVRHEYRCADGHPWRVVA